MKLLRPLYCPAWNRCDVCGRFIAFEDFDRGAVRQLVTPDSAYTRETYETLCIEHATAGVCLKCFKMENT